MNIFIWNKFINFWIRQYPYYSHIFRVIDILGVIIFAHSNSVIIFVNNLSLRFKSRFGRFHEDFSLKEGTVLVPLPFSRNRPENHSRNLGKALGEGLGLLKTGSPSLYPFHLSIPFTSLSFSNGRFRPCLDNIYLLNNSITASRIKSISTTKSQKFYTMV